MNFMIFYIFLVLILLLIVYLLIVPIIFYIDTLTHQYYIQIKGVLKVDFLYDEADIMKLKLRVLGFDHYVYPLRPKLKSKTKSKALKASKKSHAKLLSFKKIGRILKSFEVNQFYMDIDTGDCLKNAKLYPVCACCNFYFGSQMFINFQGSNRLLLSIRNRPIRLIKAYMNI